MAEVNFNQLEQVELQRQLYLEQSIANLSHHLSQGHHDGMQHVVAQLPVPAEHTNPVSMGTHLDAFSVEHHPISSIKALTELAQTVRTDGQDVNNLNGLNGLSSLNTLSNLSSMGHVMEPEKKIRKRSSEDAEQTDDEDDDTDDRNGISMPEFGNEDTASSMRKGASSWILKNFQHNFAQNYTGISKDFVYQLYHQSFPPNIPLLSAPQFTRLFNEIMYKDIEFNPRARKTPSAQIVNELFPMIGASLDVIEKNFGQKERRITYFPKVVLSAHVKELKDCALHNNFNQAAFVESLRVCKKASDTPKLQNTKRRLSIGDGNMLGPQPYRVYISDKFIVVAIDLAGVSPENVELSFPSSTESTPMHARNDPEKNEYRLIRIAHKEGVKTYEESQLMENPQFGIFGPRRPSVLNTPFEVQLPEAVEVPVPGTTSQPFIHDHYGTIFIKLSKKVTDEQYKYSNWSKEPLNFE